MNFEIDKRCNRDRSGLKMLILCGDRSIGEANLRKGQRPFNGSGTAARDRGGLEMLNVCGDRSIGECQSS